MAIRELAPVLLCKFIVLPLISQANSIALPLVSDLSTAWKVSKYGVFSGSYIPLFSPNTGKYGPEKVPYLDTFHAVEPFRSCLKGLFEL